MHTTTETIINFRNCPYTIGGENLANLRRVKLQQLARKAGIDVGDQSKNQLLTQLLAKLSAMGAPSELFDDNTQQSA